MSTAQSNGQQNVVNDLTADEIDEIMGTEIRREERPVTTPNNAQTVNRTGEEAVGEMRSPKRTTKVQVQKSVEKRSIETKPKTTRRTQGNRQQIIIHDRSNKVNNEVVNAAQKRVTADLDTAMTYAYYNDYRRIGAIRSAYVYFNPQRPDDDFKELLRHRIRDLEASTLDSENKESYIMYLKSLLVYGMSINPVYYNNIMSIILSPAIFDRSGGQGQKGGTVYIVKKTEARNLLTAAFPGEWMATYSGKMTVNFSKQKREEWDITIENIAKIKDTLNQNYKPWITNWSMTCTIYYGPFGIAKAEARMDEPPFSGKLPARNLYESFKTYAIRKALVRIFPMTTKRSADSHIGRFIETMAKNPSGIGVSVADYDDYLRWDKSATNEDMVRYLEGGDDLWKNATQETFETMDTIQGNDPIVEEMDEVETLPEDPNAPTTMNDLD